MRVAALEEALRANTPEDLDKMISALDLLCEKLPEQLIQENGLRTLRELTKLAKLNKKINLSKGA